MRFLIFRIKVFIFAGFADVWLFVFGSIADSSSFCHFFSRLSFRLKKLVIALFSTSFLLGQRNNRNRRSYWYWSDEKPVTNAFQTMPVEQVCWERKEKQKLGEKDTQMREMRYIWVGRYANITFTHRPRRTHEGQSEHKKNQTQNKFDFRNHVHVNAQTHTDRPRLKRKEAHVLYITALPEENYFLSDWITFF